MDPAPGSVVGEKYRLDRPLARGGMGSVWAGWHLLLDVPVAIKFMAESAGTSILRARFEREARAAASLRSPHVVQVLDYGSADGSPFIVMELLEGEDLAQRLARRGRLGLHEIAKIVAELAKGLTLAHEAGIVHRDLKPSNVFLAKIGGDEIAKILDFGVAKETRLEVSDVETTTGTVIGSPSYMSPEQARGGTIDARSDLWSLAVIVFQALTGTRPFAGTNLGDVLVRICTDPLPIAGEIVPGLPPEVDAFFERALCRSPDGRFQDARALAAALEAIAAGAPLADRRTSEAARDETAPRTDATASLAIPAGARAALALQPSDPSVATVLTPAALREETAAPIETSPSHRSAGALPLREGSSRRGAVWALGGALAVGAVWGGSRLVLPDGGRPSDVVASGVASGSGAVDGETMTESLPSSGPSITPAASAPGRAAASVEGPLAEATASAPVAGSAAPPAAMPGSTTPATPHSTGRHTGTGGSKPRSGGAQVDPKFGLPGGR